jgi:hypothetical protein
MGMPGILCELASYNLNDANKSTKKQSSLSAVLQCPAGADVKSV